MPRETSTLSTLSTPGRTGKCPGGACSALPLGGPAGAGAGVGAGPGAAGTGGAGAEDFFAKPLRPETRFTVVKKSTIRIMGIVWNSSIMFDIV